MTALTHLTCYNQHYSVVIKAQVNMQVIYCNARYNC